MDDERVEAVLRLVEAIPEGRATTYGRIAAAFGTGPRVVGSGGSCTTGADPVRGGGS